MRRILVVGEDALCCALGERLIAAALPNWQLAGPSIDTGGITRLLPSLDRYAEQAKYVQPVLCVADTDGRCAVELATSNLPHRAPETLLLRFAVTEAESWLLADRQGFAAALQVPANRLPHWTDDIDDPKRLLLQLAARSRKRLFREELVSPRDPGRPGTGYNVHLTAFVRSHWNAGRARQTSPSLDRALDRLRELGGRNA